MCSLECRLVIFQPRSQPIHLWLVVGSPRLLRAGLKSDHGRWPFPWSKHNGPTYGLISFEKNQFTKLLGPSPGWNQMWIKRNDHAPKNECAGCFLIYVQKGSFEKEKKRKFNFYHSLVFSCHRLLFSPQKIPSNSYFNMSSLPWTLACFYKSTSFASPTSKGPC